MKISKQAVHQLEKRYNLKVEIGENLIPLVEQIRKDHPTMSIRCMFHMIRPEGIGRDRFETLLGRLGYKTYMPRNYRRTTNSAGVNRFDNLTIDLALEYYNQLWVSDITYFEIGDRFFYITFITDAFSRVIRGHSVSETLRTIDTTIPALIMALKSNKPNPGLILHSDGGGQYYCREFTDLTRQWKIRNSMGKESYENPYAERINGTIKNCYLRQWSISSFTELVGKVDHAVKLYNQQRPHSSLMYQTPVEYEKASYIYPGQTAESEESQTADLATDGASSPLVARQTASRSDVHPADLEGNSLKLIKTVNAI